MQALFQLSYGPNRIGLSRRAVGHGASSTRIPSAAHTPTPLSKSAAPASIEIDCPSTDNAVLE